MQYTKNASASELYELRKIRWLCRTDILYLCNNVLGYKDIVPAVHGPIMDILQKFPLPDSSRIRRVDEVMPGVIEYHPWMDMYALEGKRRRLILDPRSGLKTTINCIAHTIQWLINYPWTTVLIFQSTGQKAELTMREIREHFQYNSTFRAIFPDLVPQKGIADWGNKTQFTIPNDELRAKYISKYKLIPRKEPSVMAISIDQGTSGMHFDQIKFSDIVETNNSKTISQIQDVIYNFRMSEKLLQRPDSWMDVEGTRYHFKDLYGDIIDKWLDEDHWPGFRDRWDVHVRGCFLRKSPYGRPLKYTPDELDYPFERDSNGKRISWWPVGIDNRPRWPVELLEAEEREDATTFSSQRLNNPAVSSDAYFPLNRSNIWIDREDFWKLPISHHTVTVDTAETITGKSDYSCIMVCAWDGYGRCYIHDIRWGKFKPSDIIDQIFDVNALYKPQMIYIENTGFVRGLNGDIERSQIIGRRLANGKVIPPGTYLPLEFLKRETQISKMERILNTLQPWWKGENIRILTDLGQGLSSPGCKEELIRELTQFPKGNDDIIDALSDQFANKTWFGRERARPNLDDLNVDPVLGVKTGPNEYDPSMNANSRLRQVWAKAQDASLERMVNPRGGDIYIPEPGQEIDPMLRRTGGL